MFILHIIKRESNALLETEWSVLKAHNYDLKNYKNFLF